MLIIRGMGSCIRMVKNESKDSHYNYACLWGHELSNEGLIWKESEDEKEAHFVKYVYGGSHDGDRYIFADFSTGNS